MNKNNLLEKINNPLLFNLDLLEIQNLALKKKLNFLFLLIIQQII